MKETGEEGRVLVPMKLDGFGSSQSSPDAMVLLLIPVEDDKYRLPNGEQMIYPVGVAPAVAPIYFAKLTQLYECMNDTLLEMSNFYELMSETKLQTLHIYQGKSGARPYLVYRDKNGEENSFRVSLPNGILTAMSHNLPILVEQKLLESTASAVRVNRGEPTSAPNEKRGKSISPADIGNEIIAGNKPESPMDEDLKRAIANFSPEEHSLLRVLAIKNENYEWAAVLKELEDRDE